MLNRTFLAVLAALGTLALALPLQAAEPVATKPGFSKIKHIVVIYLENHSFDNLYGEFSGANGLSAAGAEQITQVDATGTPYNFLPSIPGSSAFPLNLPNNIFNKYHLLMINYKISMIIFRCLSFKYLSMK